MGGGERWRATVSPTLCWREEAYAFTAKKDFGSEGPGLGGDWARCLAQKLAFEPGSVSLGEFSCFGVRAASRNGNARDSVGAQSQNIPARAPMAGEPQAHLLRANLQPGFVWHRIRLGTEEPLKLHGVI
jgi:hypothetical protein